MLGIIKQILVLLVCINYLIFSALLLVLFKASTTEEYLNLTFSTISSLYPKSSPVKYSYLSNSPDHNAELLAAYLSKSY